jgi:hypothetical protein
MQALMSAGLTDESGCCPDFHGAYLPPRSARAVRGVGQHLYSSSIIIPQQIRGFSLSRTPEACTLTYRRRPNR